MIPEEYSNADSERIWKGIFMPHTLLGKSDTKKQAEAQQKEVLAQSRKDAKQAKREGKKKKKTLMLAMGGLLVVGLGVGLYFAFKK